MRKLVVISSFMILIFSCQKEIEMLTGEIKGTVRLVDQSYQELADQSGVYVSLMKDQLLVQETTTDVAGNFSFEEVDYGKYTLPLTFENYVNTLSSSNDQTRHVVYHVGGYSPTTVSYALWEVPTWELSVDSLTYEENGRFKVYLKVNGDTLPPYPSVRATIFDIRGYASLSPDVSFGNHTAWLRGNLDAPTTGSPDYDLVGAVYGMIYVSSGMYELSGQTIYIRFYPCANGQYIFAPVDNPAALGPPSNVVAFDFDP